MHDKSEEKVTQMSPTLNSKEEKIWYVAVWINERNYDQLETDKGLFGGTVTFEAGEDIQNNYRDFLKINVITMELLKYYIFSTHQFL